MEGRFTVDLSDQLLAGACAQLDEFARLWAVSVEDDGEPQTVANWTAMFAARPDLAIAVAVAGTYRAAGGGY